MVPGYQLYKLLSDTRGDPEIRGKVPLFPQF